MVVILGSCYIPIILIFLLPLLQGGGSSKGRFFVGRIGFSLNRLKKMSNGEPATASAICAR